MGGDKSHTGRQVGMEDPDPREIRRRWLAAAHDLGYSSSCFYCFAACAEGGNQCYNCSRKDIMAFAEHVQRNPTSENVALFQDAFKAK